MGQRMMVIAVLWLSAAANFSIAQRPVPTEESLISAWEIKQRSDPATLKFEKISERTYRFHTNRFPFDGELKLLNVVMEDSVEFDGEAGYNCGTLEVELVGFQSEIEKYGRSYGTWLQTNTLFYDRDRGNWLSMKEYRTQLSQKYQNSPRPVLSALSQYFWLMFLILLCAILLWVSRKSSRQMGKAQKWQDEAMEHSRKALALSEKSMQLMEKSIELHEEANAILNKMLKRLEEKS